MIISRSQKLCLILLLLLALFISACGGGAATSSPDETDAAEATEAPATQARATAAPTATQTNLISDSSAVGDTFPCNARMVDDQGSILRVLLRQPSASAPLVGARRGGQDVVIDRVVVNDEGVWYGILENNQTIGYVLTEYLLLSEACVSGGGNGAEASEEAPAEATAEATQEA
jgi:hypothetical protein